MGMSTHVTGIRPASDKHRRMREIYRICREADMHPPTEVYDYFGDEGGCPIEDESVGLHVDVKSREWNDDNGSGLEIDIADLPAGVKTIRFYNSW